MKNFLAGMAVMALAFICGIAAANAQVVTTVEVVIQDEVSSYDVDETGVSASVRCNNENFDHSARCQSPVDVNTLTLEEDGFSGSLLSGVQFRQTAMIAKLHKMTVEDAYWYIDKKGNFDAANDFVAFSIYLTRMF